MLCHSHLCLRNTTQVNASECKRMQVNDVIHC
jgi:hypothetical protein